MRAIAWVVASLLFSCSGTPPSDDGVRKRPDGGADSAIEDGGEEDSSPSDGGDEDSAPVDAPSDVPIDAGPECALRPACDAPLPDVGPKRDWNKTSSSFTSKSGSPRHRGRDLFLKAGQPQWALAKFSYGSADDDIKEEDVDVYLLRDCGTSWTKVGTFKTSTDGQNGTIEGVEDTGGRVYVELSKVLPVPLGVGRHRVHFVVAGDLSRADQYIEVLPEGARIVVSDIDGTLTTSETAAWTDIFGGTPPDANPGSAQVMTTLAKRGFYVFYLTARPEWLARKTYEWIALRGFPPGIIHTTLSKSGATGAEAATYKTNELAALKSKTGITPTYAFGNTDSDRDAYTNAKISPPANAYYFKYTGDAKGGTKHDDYTKLVPGFASLPPMCL